DLVHDLVDLLGPHRPLVAGFCQAAANLVGVERLARLVLLDDLERGVHDVLYGPDFAAAVRAGPPPADGEVPAPAARINHREVALVAERTFHGPRPRRLANAGYLSSGEGSCKH